MDQPTFADLEYQGKKRKTRRELFLQRMDGLIPWQKLEQRIRPVYPKPGKGRRPYPLPVMLRIHCVQLFYNLSDPGMEDLLYEAESVRRFVGLSLSEALPDETTILNFRHLLERHGLGKGLFEEINAHLESQGLRLREGTIVDASIIEAPSSTKNRAGERDPEMHQTKKGNQWHFAVSSEIYDMRAASDPEALERLMDMGADWEPVEGVEDGLGTLADNLGIDVPDSLVKILPYAGAIAAGARLVYGVMRTEREFREANRTTRNKIQVVLALCLMARMGITTVLSATGASGGGAVGTAVLGVGNLIGSGVGALGGGLMGVYLNWRLKSHMLRLGLNICGMEEDDLFCFKNESGVDRLALSFQETANQLAKS